MATRNNNRRNGGTGQAAGAGGETHQVAQKPEQSLTTNQGIPVSDNQN